MFAAHSIWCECAAKGCLLINGIRNLKTDISNAFSAVIRGNRDRHSPDRGSVRRVRIIQSILVYSLVAFLSFAGGEGWQREAHSVGRDSSHSNSSSNGLGSLESYGQYASADSGYSDLGIVRVRVRVHDSSPGVGGYGVKLVAAVDASVQPVKPPSPKILAEYSCRELEDLWDDEGGNPDDAFVAAEISRAESSGRSDAVSPMDWNGESDWGLWQINGSHYPADPYVYLNPLVNVRAAIAISDDGRDWYPWTTYTSGAYYGMC